MVSPRRGSQPYHFRADEPASLKPAIQINAWTTQRGVERIALAPSSSFSYHIHGPRLSLDTFFEAYLKRQNGPMPLLDWSNVTSFTRTVLDALQTLPFGVTCTYGELAAQIGSPKGARAVGNALGLNPFPLLLPCHRVVARNGLGGFSAGGLKVKQALLSYEFLF